MKQRIITPKWLGNKPSCLIKGFMNFNASFTSTWVLDGANRHQTNNSRNFLFVFHYFLCFSSVFFSASCESRQVLGCAEWRQRRRPGGPGITTRTSAWTAANGAWGRDSSGGLRSAWALWTTVLKARSWEDRKNKAKQNKKKIIKWDEDIAALRHVKPRGARIFMADKLPAGVVCQCVCLFQLWVY